MIGTPPSSSDHPAISTGAAEAHPRPTSAVCGEFPESNQKVLTSTAAEDPNSPHKLGSLRRLAICVLIAVPFIALLASMIFWVRRMPTTDITLTAEASELGFTLERAHDLLSPLELASLTAAGLSTIEVLRQDRALPQVLTMGKGGPLGVIARAGDNPRNSLTIDVGSLPAGTTVWLAASDADRTYKLFLHLPHGGEISATAHGSVSADVAVPGSSGLRTFAKARTLRLAFDRDADLTIELRRDKDARLSPAIPITRLDLHRLPQYASVAIPEAQVQSGVRPIPTLISGSIIFEDLPNKRTDLFRGQYLFVRPIHDAQLLHVVLGKEGITFTMQGTVAELRTGPSRQRDLMPNQFQYYKDHDWVKVTAAILTSLLTIIGGFAAWFSPDRKDGTSR